MSDAFYVGSIGLETQQRALDGIANNIANVNTPAFKRTQISFSDIVASRAPADASRTDQVSATDTPGGVTLDSQFMLNESGEIDQTGQAMDVAIQGNGFIELMGADGQTLLWRGGTMRINDDGQLATASGTPLKTSITVPKDATAITIGTDGTVTATVPESTTAVELGQIQLVAINDPSTVDRLDGGIYQVKAGTTLTAAQPGGDGLGTLVQGALERSNVQLTDEMVQMMLVQRAYGANAQILQAADQMMAIANGLRR